MRQFQKLEDRLLTPIQYVKGVGPKIASLREERDPDRRGCPLLSSPGYEDRRNLKKISELKAGQKETGFGEILLSGFAFFQGRRRRVFEAVVGDGSGTITLKWFHGHGRYLMGTIQEREEADLLRRGEMVQPSEGDSSSRCGNGRRGYRRGLPQLQADRPDLFRNRGTSSEDAAKADEDHPGWVCR